MHALVGQNVLSAVRAGAAFRRNPHDRKIRGAAANIGDQCVLFALDGLLIGQGRGNGLVLELDLGKSLRAGDFLEGVARRAVRRRIVVHEMDRAAEHGTGDAGARRAFGRGFEAGDDQPDDFLISVDAGLDPRGLVHQAAAEDRL
jgi:hypothetical protein